MGQAQAQICANLGFENTSRNSFKHLHFGKIILNPNGKLNSRENSIMLQKEYGQELQIMDRGLKIATKTLKDYQGDHVLTVRELVPKVDLDLKTGNQSKL